MKANLKGSGGIKGLLLLHGEKLAILAVGVCTLLFIYYSTRLERLEPKYQATELQQKISLTKADVAKGDWNTAVSEHPDEVRVVMELAKSADPIVKPENYLFRGVDPPVIPATLLRSDPEMLVAVDVRGTGGSGLLPFIDEQVMKERQMARQAEEEQKAQEEAKKAEKEQQLQEEGGGRNPRNRNGDRDGEMLGFDVDPEHPNRRPVEGVGRAPGAQVMGDERIERAVWAIVVAKVPIKEQLKLYRDAFENTRGGYDPQFDFPRYAGYFVQRAEVRPGQELQWVNVDVYDGQGHKIGKPGKPAPPMRGIMNQLYQVIAKEWAAEMPELVDQRYLDFEGLLAFPLPPLLGRDWGAEVTHPDIPLAINAPPPEEEIDPTLATPAETSTDATDEDSFFQPADPSQGAHPAAGWWGDARRRLWAGWHAGRRRRWPGRPERLWTLWHDGPPQYEYVRRRRTRWFRLHAAAVGAALLQASCRKAWIPGYCGSSISPSNRARNISISVRLVLDDPNNFYVNARHCAEHARFQGP